MNETIAHLAGDAPQATIKVRGDLIITYPNGVWIMAKSTKTTFTAAALATELGTDARTARKFFRSPESGIAPVGKGARYTLEFTPTQVKGLRTKFEAWTAAATARKAEKLAEGVPATVIMTTKTTTTGTKSSPDTVITVESEEEVSVEDLTDEEFTQMIAEIEAEGDEVEA